MRILMLSSGDRVPSARFRLHPFVRPLRSRGHTVTILSSIPQKYEHWNWLGFRPSQKLKRAVRYWHALRARLGSWDVVMFDREIFDAPDTKAEQRFRAACPRMVLDIDDATFLRYPGKFEQLAQMSDCVVAGNRYLAEFARRTNPQTVEIPTCVPLDEYPEVDRTRAAPRPVIGWMGTSANVRYLTVVAPALQRLAAQHDFELRLIVPTLESLDREALDGVRVEHVGWDKSREVQQLRQIDIGIMPLFAEQEWDKYKCGLKLVQYMAIGVPGVASPVGVNSEIVQAGQSGFLAATEDEWVQALGELLSNPARRREVGQAARQRVAEKYSIAANLPRLERALAGED